MVATHVEGAGACGARLGAGPPRRSIMDPSSRAGQLRNMGVLTVLLVPLTQPVRVLSDLDLVWPAVLGLVVLVVTYLLVGASAIGLAPGVLYRFRYVALGVLAVTGFALSFGYPSARGWGLSMLYVAIGGALILPSTRQVLLWLLGLVAASAATMGVLGWEVEEQWLWLTFGILLPGLLTFSIRRTEELVIHLKQTRAQLAAAAVETERLRFSRDLHDLLGHTLSLIVVKAEVARRSADQDPPAVAVAAREAGEIERIGRRALAEVREAVTGYRDRSLDAEFDAARDALAAAGIDGVFSDGQQLPPPVAAVFAWVVREGVTNVVRHSGARRCQVEVRRAGSEATVEVRDDGPGRAGGSGPGGAAPGGGPSGRGLAGLAERVAALGGRLEAGAAPGGGWRLVARVPLTLAEQP